VKRLVHLHHGSVQVRSTQGQGTVFSVFLPIDDTPLPAPEPTAQRDWGSGKTSLRSALIVDDNDINVLPLRAFLRLSGVDVMVARGAEEAIHLIRDRHPDVTFMDIQMPHIDGFEAMRRLRADRTTADSAIIALTALAMSGDRENCLSAGADAYLSKPVKLREALQLAERVVASKAAASVLRDGR
jgi:CheY-like chemotaxis protein